MDATILACQLLLMSEQTVVLIVSYNDLSSDIV